MSQQCLPLTAVQQDIYFDQLHFVELPLYNVGGYIALPAIDLDRLQRAHQQLIEQCDVFGIRLRLSSQGVTQFISSVRDTRLPVLDFSQAEDPLLQADQWLSAHFQRTMPLDEVPLFDAYLLKLSVDRWYYVGKAHHLCMDGWGFANWASRLSNYYQDASVVTVGKCWPDIVQQNIAYNHSDKYEVDRLYWQQTLQHLPEQLFQVQHFRQQNTAFSPSQRQILKISAKRSLAFAGLAKQLQVPVAQLYHALVAIYFSRCYQQHQLLFGCPVHNRSSKMDKMSLGVFVSVIPVLLELDADATLNELCRQIAQKSRQNYKHQRYPVGEMFREFVKGTGREWLYDIGFNYLRLDSQLDFDGQPAHLVYLSHQHQQNPLMLTIWEYGDTQQAEIQVDFNLLYFSATEIELMLGRLDLLFNQLLEQPTASINSYEVIPPKEQQILQHWSEGPELLFDTQILPHQLFEQQALAEPAKTALICAKQQLTYSALNVQANQLAHRLLELSWQPGQFVGIHCHRSVEMVVAVLAAMKSGIPFVALDPEYPEQRLTYIVSDCKVGVVLTQVGLPNPFGATQVIVVDQHPELTAFPKHNPQLAGMHAEQLAYCIYTSGSTGQPKGVLIRQRNLLSLLYWARQTFSDHQLRSVLVSTSLNFDLSMFELFVPLCFGFQCVLVRNPLSLLEQQVDVSLINTVPSAIRALLRADAVPKSVNTVNLAGEPLSAAIVNDLLQSTSCQFVYNLYGPSEDTTYSTWACFNTGISRVPEIGKVIAGSQAYVLSAQLKPVPLGSIGELYLGGAGVAAGYQGRPALTAEKFVRLDANSGICYRTGDLVRYLQDGSLAYLGRVDEQIKLRGFRIEPGEIEHTLLGLSGVTEAVVVVADQRLLAYLVARQQDAESVKAQLAAQLPAHMVPDHVIFLAGLPLTPNGKINKKALPALELSQQIPTAGLPESPIEVQLAALVGMVLRVEPASINMQLSFFGNGGHSLSAVELVSQINQTYGINLSLHQIFGSQNLRQLATFVDNSERCQLPQIKPTIASSEPAPISLLQQRLWLLHLVQGSSANYHMPFALRLTGTVEPALLETALVMLLQRHEILRSVYCTTESDVLLQSLAAESFQLVVEQIPEMAESDFLQLLQQKSTKSFNLADDLPLRASLICRQYGSQVEYVLWFCIHHLAFDGQSVPLLLRELEQIWQALLLKQIPQLAVPELQYHDFARWQHHQLASGALNHQRDYWQQQLAGAPLRHSLPVNVTSLEKPVKVGLFKQILPAALLGQLRHAARLQQMTVFMQLHAALALSFSRAGNCQDVLIATPISNRTLPQLAELIGFFVNTLVLRVNTAQPTIGQFLQHVRDVHLSAQQHQELPFDLVVEACQVQRDSHYLPLSQILLTYLEKSAVDVLSSGGSLSWYPLEQRLLKYELEVEITEADGQASICWLYDSSIFTAGQIEQLSQQYHLILEELTAAQLSGASNILSAPLHRISGIPESERHFLLQTLNHNSFEYDRTATIPALFAAQVSSRPQHIALQVQGVDWHFSDLDQMANALATRLIHLGVNRGDLIGICCQRDITMVVSVLAVLKAGAGYVPVDPAYPVSRQQHIVTASQIKLLLTNQGLAEMLQVEQRLVLDAADMVKERQVQAPLLTVGAQDIAYVIYTSGSTGQPKGVVIRHSNAVAMLHWAARQYSASELKQVLASTSLSFDLSVFELFLPLCFGYQCVLVDNALALLTIQPAVTLINTVPSAIRTLYEQKALPNTVKVVNLAGEPLKAELLNQLLASGIGKVCNLYGPTEDTTYSTCAVFEQPVSGSPVIGQVIGNSQAYILSKSQELLPFGVAGELYLGGDGVAAGYLGQSALTDERFIANPYGKGMLYRTGDLVRYADRQGNLAFLGRLDDQIKIRGYRLELGEIEHVILQLPAVSEACVLASGDGEHRQLRAFVVARVGQADSEVQRQLCVHLTEQLPEYMQPSTIQLLAAMPLTPNGKTDKAALSRLSESSGSAIVEPATLQEAQLRTIWAKVLDHPLATCSVTGHFFQLGGHSLLAVRLSSEISRSLHLDCTVQMIFQYPTIRLLAAQLAAQPTAAQLIPVSADIDEPCPLSFAQQRIWFLTQLAPLDDAFNMSAALTIFGKFKPEWVPSALTALVQRQQILQYRFVLHQGEPLLQRHADTQVPFCHVDLSSMAPEQQQQEVQRLRQEHAAYTFNSATEMLMRLTYLQLASPNSASDSVERPAGILLLTMHHLVADGGSIPLLLQEFLSAYQALVKCEVQQLPPLPVSYADFCRWQRARFGHAYLSSQTAFWQQLLADAPPVHRLPLAGPRHTQPSRGAQLKQELPSALCRELEAQLHSAGVTLFMLLQAALALHIGRLSHEYDVVIGAPVDGRQHHQLQPLVGLLLNTTVYRTEFADNPAWSLLLERTREQHIRSLPYQDVPFEAIVEKINPVRDLYQSPIFQILLNYNNTELPTLLLDDCRLQLQAELPQSSKYDLTLYVSGDTAKGIQLCWVYNEALFAHETLSFYASEFVHLLTQLCQAPQTPVLQFGWLNRPDWPVPQQNVAEDYQIWQLLELQAQQRPAQPALSDGDHQYSYRELACQVNQLANYLHDHGFSAGQRAAILTQRHAQRIISILAVLKAGGAYVPLSQELPESRLIYMLNNAAPTLLLTDIASQEACPLLCSSFKGQVVCIDAPAVHIQLTQTADNFQAVARSAMDEAHIIFTSGSTGLPKGVVGTCAATMNRVQWMLTAYPYQLAEPVAHITSMAFIRGVWELLVPLCGGAHLILCDRDVVRDTTRLWHWLKHHQIRRLVTAPSLMKALTDVACTLQEQQQMPLHYWFVSGEPLLQQHANAVLNCFPELRLFNLYGSTEVMSDVLVKEIYLDLQQHWVTLGLPITGADVCILADDGLPAPDHVVGEIAVLGCALANGYLSETANSPFIDSSAGRVYRTGDLGLRRSDGDISCLGRRDDQIKIRGYRVEPGEIRALLIRHPAVQNCYVRPWPRGEQLLLIAYLVVAETAQTQATIREQLVEQVRASLPFYMQLSAYIFVDALPLRPNGKVDRQALPEPDLIAVQTERVPPANETERQLCLLWGELLQLEPTELGVTSCFFELGGHSLLITQLQHQLSERFGLVLSYQELFANRTVRYQATRISRLKQMEDVVNPRTVTDSLKKILI
ncbi:hypothetical protein A5320_03930 [Rheinheimera sp. SA_1]|nr:hypothetical protein A5320_03930 [Rheinheimera sp. SA_1]